MHPEFGVVVQKVLDEAGGELPAEAVYKTFEKEYLLTEPCYKLKGFNVVKRHIDEQEDLSSAEVEAMVLVDGKEEMLRASGNGPLDAFCEALRGGLGLTFTLQAYHEHALTKGSSSKAVSYIMITDREEKEFWGAGVDTDIIVASIKALLSAMNRACYARRKS
jgi:2-isopropylmalate synthase